MRLALDTNRFSDLFAGIPEVIETIESATSIFMPFAVLAELRGGFTTGARQLANERALRAFMSKPFVSPLFADEETVSAYAALSADLRRRGRSIPHNDIWIAAICVQHSLTLYTRDRHFDYLPQVTRV